MRPPEQSITASKDGSHTAFSSKYNAHYHSIYGALEESIHVFISAGLFYKYRKACSRLSILEMGFGTGLNALLSLIESKRFGLDIDYHTVESDPFSKALVPELNYSQILNLSPDTTNLFQRMHDHDWNVAFDLTPQFTFKKMLGDIRELSFDDNYYDIIYYDAFAPSCQSYLWEIDLHQKLFKALRQGGILVTYCTQGAFKRNLKRLGYQLDLLNGPSKKREMLRAIKP